MVDLSVELAGLKLKNPLIVGAGPNTKNVPTVTRCMEAGFGAVVVRSTHIQFPDRYQPPMREFWCVHSTSKNFARAFYSFQSMSVPTKDVKTNVAPGFGGGAPMPTLEQWAEEVRKMTRAAKAYDCAIIASLGWCGSNLSTEEEWKAEARAMTEAGVDALQLHTAPSPATEPGRYMTLDPRKYLEMPIRAVKEVSDLPVFAKLAVDGCDAVTMASIAEKAGADGVVPATRWTSIPIVIENEKSPVWPGPGIGGPWSVPIMNSLIYRMRHANEPIKGTPEGWEGFPDTPPITVAITPSGGVRSGKDVIGYIMAGADAAEVCAQVIIEGVGVAGRIEKEIRDWMERKGYRRIRGFEGILRLMRPEEVRTIPDLRPVVDAELCNACGKCLACVNEAITLVENVARVDDALCEGCRTCYYVCPTNAISLTQKG